MTQPRRRVIDLTGQRFGLLEVVSLADSGGPGRAATWTCLCDCGGQREARGVDLRRGKTTHCGCRRRSPGPTRRVVTGPACERPTASHPEGRTGRDSGYQAHARYGQKPCGPCAEAHAAKSSGLWASLTDEERQACRDRNRAEAARYRANDPVRARANAHRRISLMRQVLRKAKSSPCADCQTSYPYYVMQFDHLGDKEFNIGVAVNRVSEKRLLAEIAKCDVVCANCHAQRTHDRRVAGRSA